MHSWCAVRVLAIIFHIPSIFAFVFWFLSLSLLRLVNYSFVELWARPLLFAHLILKPSWLTPAYPQCFHIWHSKIFLSRKLSLFLTGKTVKSFWLECCGKSGRKGNLGHDRHGVDKEEDHMLWVIAGNWTLNMYNEPMDCISDGNNDASSAQAMVWIDIQEPASWSGSFHDLVIIFLFSFFLWFALFWFCFVLVDSFG